MGDRLMERLQILFESDEGKQKFDEWLIRQEQEELHNSRWVERVWDRIKSDIDGSIRHILNWYESNEYRDREYRIGFEPRESLLWILFHIAEKYGRKCTELEMDIYSNMFTGDMFVIGSYVIQVMHGQGSIIRLDKIS